MPLPLTVSCSVNPDWFYLSGTDYPGSPGQRAVKQVYVCVCFTYLSVCYIECTDCWLLTGTYPCGDLGFAPVAVFGLGDKSVIAASTANEQSHVAIMAVDGGEMVTTLKPQQTAGMVMDIKAGGEDLVMAGYEDGSIVVWDIRFPQHDKNCAKLHNEAVSSFDYCERTQRGVSASVDGSLMSWGGIELMRTATAHIKGGAACVRARPDGKLFAVGGCDSRIHIYSGSPKLLRLAVVRAHTQSVQSLAFNNCDQTFAAGSRDKTVSMWSIYKDS